MVSRRTAIRYYVLGLLCLTALTAQAQQIRNGEFIELRRDSVRTGMFFAITVNADTLELFAASRRIIDSLITARAGGSVREELKYTASTGSVLSGANDSINVLIDGTGYQLIQFAYDMYADRILISTNKPGAVGPTTWRDDLPRVSTDSLLILRLSRNASFAAGQKIGATLNKVAKGSGLSFTNTSGVFYDMLRFDEAQWNSVGSGTQSDIVLLLKKNR